jgi:hypothetical protein
MSDMRMYNILGVFKGLTKNTQEATPLNESVQQTVYEPVEPRGSIMQAVQSLEDKFKTFKESKAKPDFLDVDKDGNKAEPFKKAVKDKKAVDEGTIAKPKKDLKKHSATAKRMATQKKADKDHESWLDNLEKTDPDHPSLKYRKQATNEGQGPYELYNPKHPKFKANHDKWMKKNPGKKLADFIEAMKKKEATMNEAIDDLTDLDDYQFADPDKDTAVKPMSAKQAAADRRRRLQDIEDRKAEKDDWFSGKDKESNVRIHRAKLQDEPELDEATPTPPPAPAAGTKFTYDKSKLNPMTKAVDEVAPPGAKAERMVKHIKKGYAKDGNLSKKEKGIAYATAWKAKKEGNLEEGTEFKDAGKIKNSAPNMKKAKLAKVTESRVMEETDYFYERIGKSLAEKNPNLDTATGEFEMAVRKEMVAQGIDPNRARNILLMDEDFLSDVATSYAHCCKDVSECGAPINSFVGGTEELDEIAKLAGLPVRETDIVYDQVNHEEPQDTMDETALGAVAGGVAGAALGKSPAAASMGAQIGDELIEGPGVTVNGKEVDINSIEVDGVNDWDSPDFADAYITYATFADGTPMSDEELVQLETEHGDLVNQAAHGSLQSRADFLDEEDMAEGNEFSGALAKAKAAGAKEFEVDGKKYTVKEDVNINISANGDEDVLALVKKLAGLPGELVPSNIDEPMVDTGHSQVPLRNIPTLELPQDIEEERDVEYTNTPNEKIAPLSAAIPSGADLNRSKKQYKKEYPGDNPMAVKEAALWKSYENMINDIKD